MQMEKIIRVESCAGCDIKEKYKKETPFGEEHRYWCPKLAKQIEWYISNKTLPDDCPLDDEIKSVTVARYNALKDEKDRLYKAISIIEKTVRRDATKHIRAAWNEECEGKSLDQEKHLKLWDGYRKMIAEGHTSSLPRDWFESILAYITVLETAIRADLKDKEAGG